MRPTTLLLLCCACSAPAATPAAPAPAAPAPAAPAPEAAAAAVVVPTAPPSTAPARSGLLGPDRGADEGAPGGAWNVLGGGEEEAGLGGGWGEVTERTLSSCFPSELGGLAMMRMDLPPGFGEALFARAYIERRPGGRSININVWDAAMSNLEGQLSAYPVLGEERARRAGNGIERVGGAHEGHPSEADWEELTTGGHRDTLTVRVSETRLVSLTVQPDAERGDAAALFAQLELACLETAPL